MSKAIKAEELQKAIQDYLENYLEDIEDEVKETTDNVTKEAKKELTETSPRGKGSRNHPYHKGWAIKLKRKTKGQYYKAIWNKTNYQLAHLLEDGHATRNGGRTRAIPHIKPVEEKYNLEYLKRLESRIRRISK